MRREGSFNAAVDLCSSPWNSRDPGRYVHSEAKPLPASDHVCAKHNQRPCPNSNPSIVPKLGPDPATIGPSGTTCNPILQLLVEQARFYTARKSIKLGKCFSFHFRQWPEILSCVRFNVIKTIKQHFNLFYKSAGLIRHSSLWNRDVCECPLWSEWLGMNPEGNITQVTARLLS